MRAGSQSAVTTIFFLVRHAAHDAKILAGRLNGIHLSEAGQAQAKCLASRLSRETVDAIYTSPRERAAETAAAIARACGCGNVTVAGALDEVDFGSWSGHSFEELESDPAWQSWNKARSLCRTPGGESMLDIQRRALSLMAMIAGEGKRSAILVTHAEVIRAAALYYLGLPVDSWPRIEISPASITIIHANRRAAKVTRLNEAAY
jgi:broad specificity phosphatase PhoE